MLVRAKLQFDATRKKHIDSPCGLSLPFPFLVRLRDHGAWPGISQYSIISHFLSRIFISHFLSRIFISHFLSRIFISHLYLAFLFRISHFYLAFLFRIFITHVAFLSRIFISHLAFFSSHLAFLSRISHFYLAFNSRIFFLLLLSRISNVPYRLTYYVFSYSRITFDEFFVERTSSIVTSHAPKANEHAKLTLYFSVSLIMISMMAELLKRF